LTMPVSRALIGWTCKGSTVQLGTTSYPIVPIKMASCMIQSGNWPTCFAFRPLENNFDLSISSDLNCEHFLFIDPRMDPSKSRWDEGNFIKMDQSHWWVFQYWQSTFSDIAQKLAEGPIFYFLKFQNRNNFLTEKDILNAIEICSNIFFHSDMTLTLHCEITRIWR
jgi:hypothetical protein